MPEEIKTSPNVGLPIPRNTLEALQLVYEGASFLDQGEVAKAETTWLEAVKLDPTCSIAWSLLTDSFEKNKRTEEAVDALGHWIATAERSAENLFLLGNRSCTLKQYEQGKKLVQEALGLDPSLKLKVSEVLAKANCLQGEWEEAILATNEVLQAEPDNLGALKVACICWYALARGPEEVAAQRSILQLEPDIERHSRLLVKISYLAKTTPEDIYTESVRWSELYADSLAAQTVSHSNTPDPERILKIGYISPDLNVHALTKVLPGVFENHDPGHFEIFIYSINTKKDESTAYLWSKTKNFVDVPLNPEAIAQRVRADGIDILVDLGGHTMYGGTFLLFAMKPAPVQASWLGVLSTTGLRAIDYFIGDAYIPRPGTEHLFTEKVYRLGRTIGIYRPPGDPGVAMSPYFKNGYITFGCYNNPKKITLEMVKIWSILLHLHPTAKLIFKYNYLEGDSAQRLFRGWFADYGISMDRLVFEGESGPVEYLAKYANIDIALDPYPYNGGTTTMDALWMGVPVVSLYGRSPVSCSGASLLSAVGLSAAKSVDEYIALANQLVRDIPASPHMRKQIREAMLLSPLVDELGLAREVERAYRGVWRTWCAAQIQTSDASTAPLLTGLSLNPG